MVHILLCLFFYIYIFSKYGAEFLEEYELFVPDDDDDDD